MVLIMMPCCMSTMKDDNIYSGDYVYDEDGIIMKWYEDNYYYNPVIITNEAFYNWNENIFGYHTHLLNIDGFGEIVDNVFSIELINNQTAQDTFLIYTEWLANNYSYISDDAIVWEYNFDYFPYLQNAPWVSSMAQGGAIRIFLRAFLLTNNEYYLELAKKAVNSFKVDYEDGGFRQYDGDANVYYEEYPGNPTTHVLNGFIFAIWGLYEYWIVTGDEDCHALFLLGIETLKKRIADYDMGDNSKYDLIRLGQTFRFVIKEVFNNSQPLPVDSLYFYANSDISKARTIDVGGNDIEGNTGNHSRVNNVSTEMWSEKAIDNGRTIRFFDFSQASFCSINFLVPENCNYPGSYSLKILYKDVSNDEYLVQIYDGRQYHDIGTIIGNSTELWVENTFLFNEQFIRGREASFAYNEIHARQLLYTYKITGELIFKEYSDLFYSYNE